MPLFFRIERSQCCHHAYAKGKVSKISMLEEDSLRAQVVGGHGKYTGGEDAFESRVVVMQSLEGISALLVELQHPGS